MKREALDLTQAWSVPLETYRLAFQQNVQKGIPARPQQAKGRGVRGWYVEALSDVRTPPETFFNILSESALSDQGRRHLIPRPFGHARWLSLDLDMARQDWARTRRRLV